MERDPFIITVYCLVDDEYKKLRAVYRVRHAGFAPERSDAEVITMVICGESFTPQPDQALFASFAPHSRHFFPPLSARRRFVRQAAHLWPCNAAWQRRRTLRSEQAPDPVQPIDTLPLPVCTDPRARRDRCFAGQADSGSGDANALPYDGVQLG